MELELARLSDMLRPKPLFRQPYDWKLDSMPPGGIKLHVNPVGGTLAKVFNDSNYLQLQASRVLGVRPIMRPSDAWHTRRPLVKISSNPDFYVDNLTHSMPYLVPERRRFFMISDVVSTIRSRPAVGAHTASR